MKNKNLKIVELICLSLMMCSCGEDTNEEKQEIPKEWKGDEMEFKKSFSIRSEGNASILISAKSTLPFDGKIERNNTISSTSQNFSRGKLNGVSIKKSKDGSWVKAHYKNGVLNGEMIFYSKKGQVRTILNYENGIIKKRKKSD